MGLAEKIRVRFSRGGPGIRQVEFFRLRAADSQETAFRVLEINRVRNFLHQDFEQMPVPARDILAAMPQDCLADGGSQFSRGEPGQQEIILRAKQQGLVSQFFVRRIREQDDGNLGECAVNFGEGLEVWLFGRSEIHENKVKLSAGQLFQSGGKCGGLLASKTSAAQ